MVAQPEHHLGAPLAAAAQPPATALVDPGDAVPRHLARRVVLHDLDEPADLGRADIEAHRVARAEPRGPVALDVPARESGHEPARAVGVAHVLPHALDRCVDDELLLEPHRDPSAEHGEAALGGEVVERALHPADDRLVHPVDVGLVAELLA